MKKFALVAVAAALLAAPAYAETTVENEAEINADVGAIQKDNLAIKRQHNAMDRNRAVKERAKREGDVGQQAASSAKIGVNQGLIRAKKVERSIDKQILDNNLDDRADIEAGADAEVSINR